MKIIRWLLLMAIALSGGAMVQGCTTPEVGQQSPTSATEGAAETSEELGTLTFRANGEDFVRQGFVSKDGWDIQFEALYVNLAEVTAYQTDPPFDPEAGDTLTAETRVAIAQPQTVDLAAGDATAEPIVIAELEAPAGRYNALSWKMTPATTGPAAGYTLVMQGTATQDGQTIDFTIQLTDELAFVCGDFVGDVRKGILQPGDAADLEATFHFDHLFGDAEASPEDDINTGALGFAPLAAIAQNGTLTADSTALQTQLSPEDYAKFLSILPSLGHVGEGHCEEV